MGRRSSRSGAQLPEDLKRDILGARRRVLFVEGTPNSCDLLLYGVLFPELSVIPKGSCNEVIKAVKGLRSAQEHHHVEAFGSIDKDDRQPNEIERLAEGSIFTWDVYSVESLYHCSAAIAAVAHRPAESLGHGPHEMVSAAVQNSLLAIAEESDLPARMAARRSEGECATKSKNLLQIGALSCNPTSPLKCPGSNPLS